MFLQQLGHEWLPAISDIHERLQANPAAHVADIGCGAGSSSIAIAQAYGKVHVDGDDVDTPSVELARASAATAGVTDRVHFHIRAASDPALVG